MDYQFKVMDCPRHGKTEFVEQYGGFVCEQCMGEDLAAMEQESIEIVASLNLNGVRQ